MTDFSYEPIKEGAVSLTVSDSCYYPIVKFRVAVWIVTSPDQK